MRRTPWELLFASVLLALACGRASNSPDALPIDAVLDVAFKADVPADAAATDTRPLAVVQDVAWAPDSGRDAAEDDGRPDVIVGRLDSGEERDVALDVTADMAISGDLGPDLLPDVGAQPAYSLRWAKRATGAYPRAIVRSDDGLFVTGDVRSGARFGQGEATSATIQTSSSTADGFLARFADEGSFRWVQQMGSYRDDHARGLMVAPSGDLVVGGKFGSADYDPAIFGQRQPNETRLTNFGSFLARYGGQGQLSWVRPTGERHSSDVVALAPLPDGGTYALGTFGDRIVLAPGTAQQVTFVADVSTDGGGDSYLARYGSDGTLAWARQFASPSADFVSGMAVMDGGDVVFVGSFGTSIRLGGPGGAAATLSAPAHALNIYLARYTAGGDLAWARQLGGKAEEQAIGIAKLASGDLVIAGEVTSGVDGSDVVFGPGESASVTRQASASGNFDLFFARYDQNGHVVWARGAPGAEFLGSSIAALPDGGVAIAASFGSYGLKPVFEAVFGPGESNETRFTTPPRLSASDTAVAWYAADGSLRRARIVGAGTAPGARCDASALVAEPDGSITVVGVFEGSITFGEVSEPRQVWTSEVMPGPLPPLGGDMFMLRYNP